MWPKIGPLRGRVCSRAVPAGLTAALLVLPAAALAASSSGSANAALPASFAHRSLSFGDALAARGRLPSSDAGREVVLELAPARHGWQAVARARVAADGAYELRAVARVSGRVRVRLVPLSQDQAAGAPPPAASTSRSQDVAVAARLTTRPRRLQLLSGRAVRVSGVLLPRRAGRTVRLEGRIAGRWRTLASARTSTRGHFGVRLLARGLGTSPLRVRFAGDRANSASQRAAGRLEVFRASSASWYQLTGYRLGCGGRMGADQLGVANKTLPCGTLVTFRYGSRSVRVPVIDRGPYVGGREWDLSGATKRALGFPGLGLLWSSR